MKSKYISSGELMDLVIDALNRNQPFSMVSVGITETYVLAQYTLLSEREILDNKETYVAAQGMKRGFDHRGVRFPNTEARNLAVEAIQRADVIGYNLIPVEFELTRRVFNYYKIRPLYVFEAHTRRVIMFSQQEKFQQMLAKRRIILMCSYGNEVKAALDRNLKEKLGFEIVGTIHIEEFEDIPRVKEELAYYDFDLCLLAAGINAVILAPFIKKTYGKVAFDLGFGMESLITGKIEMPNYLERFISLKELMKL